MQLERWIPWASALAFSSLAFWFSRRYFHNVVDDALISVRYAENLAQGRGAVFNPGERVEGYTNFLWMALMALLYWPSRLLGLDFVHAVVGANLLTGALTVGLVGALGARLWPGRIWPTLCAVGLTALDNEFGVWSILGLEGHFLDCWALFALLLASRNDARRWPLIGICLACVQMTRPDGGLFVAAFLGSTGLALLGASGRERRPGTPPAWRAWLQALAVFLTVYGSYFALRYSYYGYPLPNTFYLKVSGAVGFAWVRGVDYLKSFLFVRAYLPVFSLLAVLALGSPVVRTLFVWGATHVLYITYVGGDFYPGHRFYVAMVPVFALLCASGLSRVEALAARALRGKRWAPSVVGGAMALLALGLVSAVGIRGFKHGPLRTEIDRWGAGVERNRRYMLWLRTHKPPGASMVLGDIGAAGHYADVHVYDYYGVIDPVIAHRPVPSLGQGKAGHEKTGDAAYFLAKKPTLLKWGYLQGDFYRRGYYARGDMPLDLEVDGLWERDPLPAAGIFDVASAFHFTRHEAGWVSSGHAFEAWPRFGTAPSQQSVFGQDGGYVSSFHPKLFDAATGTLRSPRFLLHGDLLTLRVAGGHDPQRLRVDLLVDGATVASVTGRNTEVFTRTSVPIAGYRGKQAELLVRDDATGGWGHIMLDEVVQWTRSAGAPAP